MTYISPVRKEEDHSYTAERVCSYIKEAYGEHVKPCSVTLGLSCGQEALELLGYKHQAWDGWFEPDPRIPDPKYPLGSWVVDKFGGVGVVVENTNHNYSVRGVKGWKNTGKCAWYSVDELFPFYTTCPSIMFEITEEQITQLIDTLESGNTLKMDIAVWWLKTLLEGKEE